MSFLPKNTYQSTNFSSEEIPVEFVLLHYTACDLKKTIEIFTDPARKVCAHFVIDTDGECYDLGNFWKGNIYRGAHAGESKYVFQGKTLEKFNQFSIGIELVNLNGNIFPYTEMQYQSLTLLLQHLCIRFPILNSASRILGHEQVAGFRGKCDPGICFDWAGLWRKLAFSSEIREPVCTAEDQKFIQSSIGIMDSEELSSKLEARIQKRLSQKA